MFNAPSRSRLWGPGRQVAGTALGRPVTQTHVGRDALPGQVRPSDRRMVNACCPANETRESLRARRASVPVWPFRGHGPDDCRSAAVCPLSSRMPFIKAERRITFEVVLETLNLRAMYLESH